MERTSREREFSSLEASRHRARSVESLSRLRISTTRGGGRSSIERKKKDKRELNRME